MLSKDDNNILLNLSLVVYEPFFDIDILNKLLFVSNKYKNNSFGLILSWFILFSKNKETNNERHLAI